MKILYLGEDAEHSSSLDRARALARLGHEVQIIKPLADVTTSRWLNALHYRTGYRFRSGSVARQIVNETGGESYDVVWVDGGCAISRELLQQLRQQSRWLVNYNLDDPFGSRDGRRWDTYRRSVREYDLVCVVRPENVSEAKVRGARRVLKVWRSYDPVSHAVVKLAEPDRQRWASEVLFVGTWMPERGPFLAELLRRNLPLTIYGNRWELAREWPMLKKAWRGPGILGTDYVKAVQCAKISLGLLSRGNRDLHTQRSLEIPFIGGLLCAERTREHAQLYNEEREAVFWSDASECVEKCQWLLKADTWRRTIAEAGHKRVIALKVSNDETVQTILDALVKQGKADAIASEAVSDITGKLHTVY